MAEREEARQKRLSEKKQEVQPQIMRAPVKTQKYSGSDPLVSVIVPIYMIDKYVGHCGERAYFTSMPKKR